MTTTSRERIARWSSGAAALAIIATTYAIARLPEVSTADRAALATRFSFTRTPLSVPSHWERRAVYPVHQSLEHLAPFVAIGAAVALADLDGNGIDDDICHVDPRVGRVIVRPAPGTGPRYPLRALDIDPLPYDRASMSPSGCLPVDLDEDGDRDLVLTFLGRSPVGLLAEGADFRPVELVEGSVRRWHTASATAADLDGDGHLDLVVGNYFGDGEPLLEPGAPGAVALPDSFSRAYNGGNTYMLRLRHIDGHGPHFELHEGVLEADVSRGWTLGLAAVDLDDDLLPELYIANDFGPDRMLHNRSTPGHLEFTLVESERAAGTPRSSTMGQDSFKGMGVDVGDLDGDGRLDLAVSNATGEYGLMETTFAWIGEGSTGRLAHGLSPFVNRAESLGLARGGWNWEIRIDDFDSDGTPEVMQTAGWVAGHTDRWPELQEMGVANDRLVPDPRAWPDIRPGDDLYGDDPSTFYVKNGSAFVDIASEVGLAEDRLGRGIATGDVDADGDLDLVVASQWSTASYYENLCPRCGAALTLDLRLPLEPSPTRALRVGSSSEIPPSRPAVGAKVRVERSDGTVAVGFVDGGNGHTGARGPRVHIGLGAEPGPCRVEIRWRDPSGRIVERTLELESGRYSVLLPWVETARILGTWVQEPVEG